MPDMFHEFWINFTHNLFKPLLLFFYMGFLIPLLKVPFEFPKIIYQGLTIYLLISIGWHGGEELATLSASGFLQALGFIVIGFITNTLIGFLAYQVLRRGTRLRQVDAMMVGGYYGSDSAGTFVTCLGVLSAAQIAYAPYMPVLLAVMEIPGCLVALLLIARLRRKGMDEAGNMPGEAGYHAPEAVAADEHAFASEPLIDEMASVRQTGRHPVQYALAGDGTATVATIPQPTTDSFSDHGEAVFSGKMLHEVFFNPGLYLLFGGIIIGFVSRLQGEQVVAADDALFVDLFHGALCLFLLEMGMAACSRLRDLKSAGWQFIAFCLLAPMVFAAIGLCVAHSYSMLLGQPFEIGTYALFAVLCAAASYIAVPAVQRLAVPEASPTLPLAASLGLTFTFNVTIGIPLYIEVAKLLVRTLPVA